jgi:hypothetical protein
LRGISEGAGLPRYHKIAHDEAAIERLFVELFLEAHANPPKQIVLDVRSSNVVGFAMIRSFRGPDRPAFSMDLDRPSP